MRWDAVSHWVHSSKSIAQMGLDEILNIPNWLRREIVHFCFVRNTGSDIFVWLITYRLLWPSATDHPATHPSSRAGDTRRAPHDTYPPGADHPASSCYLWPPSTDENQQGRSLSSNIWSTTATVLLALNSTGIFCKLRFSGKNTLRQLKNWLFSELFNC